MPDVDLITALKQAKSKKMFFAFILKGSDGQLIVSKARIPPKAIADLKKEVGGVPITGKCFGPINDMVFQVVKDPPPTLTAALKKVVKRDAGLTIVPDVQLARDADAEEPEEKGAAAPAAAPGGAPAPGGAAEAPAALDLGPWQAARQKAINDLKALAAKVAGTKHGSAIEVLKEINYIITKLPANPKPNEIDKLVDFIKNDDTISAAEDVPDHFHDLNIREPLLNALAALKQ